ncbi:tRNA (cytidine(34)-2'-O)-methyltransferase [Mechercharimyces sp. CAU 1602]|uniref:tRNA (cytidine(34)-2'-O)-methyltransferase n=1 Tax=Mechercharimyces sp. CAU 1602 TaxID=2973933 RepID=UPI002161594C|nr:tRNA (cytidine(34)-2'-O)-methyltransferase [Mechercharimyces sp. CAU 1602]MCS1351710.1 tRNA (cytidine(34)-2'-O)-methyltransferase [Mechercharimyces sp. CAU 1602]
MSFHIVLVEPEIPQNTGSISRTCVVTGTVLHLVHPLGFTIEDKYVKRAGMDYWPQVDIRHYNSFAELTSTYPEGRFFCATTKAEKPYTAFTYQEGDFFVFGKESAGLSPEILHSHRDRLIRIPMDPDYRSLNLATTTGIVLYEALRQVDFPHLI